MNEENTGAPSLPVLSMLPLRGIAVFPGMLLSFDVERPVSIAALNAALKSDQRIFLASQIDVRRESPGWDDLFKVGTVCVVKQILRVPGFNTVKVMVQGESRAKMLSIDQTSPCFTVSYEPQPDLPDRMSAVRVQALIRHSLELLSEYMEESGSVSPEALLPVTASDDPGYIADYIAQNIYLRGFSRQEVLEERHPAKRLSLVCDLLDNEIGVLEAEQELRETTEERLSHAHREQFLREQLRMIRSELGENDDDESESYNDRILAAKLPQDVSDKLLKEAGRLAKQPFGSAEGAVLRTYLDTCLELPWEIRTKERLDVSRAKKILDDDHFGLDKVKDRILEFLSVKQLAPEIKGGVLCLVGPPGTGKTSIAMSIARAMNRKLVRMSLGGVHDEAEIRGHRKTYVGAMPGRIMAGMLQVKSRNPVMVLDEIDKLGSDFRGDPSAALLEALDSEQNSSFRDHFLELPFDLSEVLFITTANTTETIPRPLLDRMELIELSSYTDEEKLEIAKRHLLPKQRKKHGLNARQLKLSDSAIRELIALYTKESGVRVLERELAAICRKCARGVAEERFKQLHVSAGDLEGLLGAAKYKPDPGTPTDEIGLVHGLAWTSVGGEVLDVECAVCDGKGELTLTGNLGDVMKESARAAITYIRSRASVLGIDPEFHSKKDIHLHFPENAVPKDGPSAGITICIALISALTNVPVKHDLAMTGEVTLRGRILAIGGLREKTMAALRAGINNVIIPAANEKDLGEIDPAVRSALSFITASHVDDILDTALPLMAASLKEKKSPARYPLPENRDPLGVTLRQ